MCSAKYSRTHQTLEDQCAYSETRMPEHSSLDFTGFNSSGKKASIPPYRNGIFGAGVSHFCCVFAPRTASPPHSCPHEFFTTVTSAPLSPHQVRDAHMLTTHGFARRCAHDMYKIRKQTLQWDISPSTWGFGGPQPRPHQLQRHTPRTTPQQGHSNTTARRHDDASRHRGWESHRCLWFYFCWLKSFFFRI